MFMFVGEVVWFINIPFIIFILQGIPELTAEVTLAFVIARIPLKWDKILMIGLVLAISSYIVRLSSIPFGIHTMFLIILLSIALIWLGKRDFSLSLLASLLSFLALTVFEFVCLSLLMPVFGVTPETLSANLVIMLAITEPQVLLTFFTAFLLNKFTKKRLNA